MVDYRKCKIEHFKLKQVENKKIICILISVFLKKGGINYELCFLQIFHPLLKSILNSLTDIKQMRPTSHHVNKRNPINETPPPNI